MKYLILILSIVTLIGCRKTETFDIRGNVKHKFTNDNIPNVYFTIRSPGIPMSSPGTFYGDDYTDNDGNFNILFDLKPKNDFVIDFIISVDHPETYDSTSNAFKYELTDFELLDYEGSSYTVYFHLTPSGLVYFYATDSTWDSIGTDSIYLQSPYESKYFVRNVSPNNKIDFYVDPSIVSTFNWCFIKDGIQSTIVTKNIYVPNRWTSYYDGSNKVFNYEIIF